MSLDLTKTALDVDAMALTLKARQDDKALRLNKALLGIDSLNILDYEKKRLSSKDSLAWKIPHFLNAPRIGYAPPALPIDFCVAAVDGSHIDVDRHLPARCYLINIGVSMLTYGSQPDARLYNQPKLYAQDKELVIRDPTSSHREQTIDGTLLSAKRMVEEIKALAQVLRNLPSHVPTLALMDGSLIMLGLIGRGYHQFVLDELIANGFVEALDEIKRLADQKPLMLASYISLPRSADVVNALRLEACPYEIAECERYCGHINIGQRPCDAGTNGLLDRDIFWRVLEPGERSGLFASSSPLIETYYQEHDVYFFYLHTGQEIGRVEVPSWGGKDETLLGLTHTLLVDQCNRGPGYPVALVEAHEQAVITGADRRHFTQLVETALDDQRLPAFPSEKSRSKRLRWL